MTEQCALLKAIAESQQELAKIMKGSAGQGFVAPGPSLGSTPPLRAGSPALGGSPASAGPMYPTMATGPGTPLTPAAPASMGFTPHVPGPPQLPPVSGRFAGYQPVVSPSVVEPNEWPSAAFVAQEVPNRHPSPIDVIDENGPGRTG